MVLGWKVNVRVMVNSNTAWVWTLWVLSSCSFMFLVNTLCNIIVWWLQHGYASHMTVCSVVQLTLSILSTTLIASRLIVSASAHTQYQTLTLLYVWRALMNCSCLSVDVAAETGRAPTYRVAQKNGANWPSYLIANILKTPWPNCVEIGKLMQNYMLNTVINFLFRNFIALWLQ